MTRTRPSSKFHDYVQKCDEVRHYIKLLNYAVISSKSKALIIPTLLDISTELIKIKTDSSAAPLRNSSLIISPVCNMGEKCSIEKNDFVGPSPFKRLVDVGPERKD